MLLCQLIPMCDTSRRLLRETAKDPETANLDRIYDTYKCPRAQPFPNRRSTESSRCDKGSSEGGKNRSLGGYSHLIGSDVHTVATRELFSEVGEKKHPDRKQVRKIKQLIVDQKADVNCRAANGWTPIHWATAEGHFESVKLLLNHGADKDMSIAIRGWESGATPLYLACRNGHLDIARLLLQYKANPGCCTERGRDWAPLLWACVHGKIELVKLLIKHGAKINRQVYGIRGDSPLFMAIEKGQ